VQIQFKLTQEGKGCPGPGQETECKKVDLKPQMERNNYFSKSKGPEKGTKNMGLQTFYRAGK